MTTDPHIIVANFRLPKQDLNAVSFCGNHRSAVRPGTVKAWAEQLPAIRIAHTSVQLYKALPEICRLHCSAEHRLEMLESLRPYVQNCIQGLAKDFLNQPLILPEGPLKTAVVAQALQKHMSTGYCLVLRDLANKGKLRKAQQQQLVLACHRALSGLTLLLLRSYQLYTPIPPGLWRDLHNLYRLAGSYGCLNEIVTDQTLISGNAISLLHVYVRALLLAASRPNQMRQQEVSTTFEALEDWSRLAKIVEIGDRKRDNLFVLDLNSDSGPVGKTRFSPGQGADVRELDLAGLVSALNKQCEDPDQHLMLSVPTSMSTPLVKHLVQAWSVNYQRAFERSRQSGTVDICVGLTAVHHHIINTIPFEQFLGAASLDDANEDSWASSFDTQIVSDADYPHYKVGVVDSSAGGYCLEWRNKIPAVVKAGELVGLREKGRHRWAVGIIRWVQQRSATRLGIQLLAPKTTPYGAAIEQDGEYSDFRRVLMVPELKAVNQPATLLTASVPYKEYDKLQLNNHGDFSEIQLLRRVFSTGSINQFAFRQYANQTAEELADQSTMEENLSPPDDDFSSVWDD